MMWKIIITIPEWLPANEIKFIWTWIASHRECRFCSGSVPWYTSGFT